MKYNEIEQLVYEDEMMELNDKNILNSILPKLENSEELRVQYFGSNLDDYNITELNKLKKAYYKTLDKKGYLDYAALKLSKLHIYCDKLFNMIDSLEVSATLKRESLEDFKTKISYLIYLGVITDSEAKERGFSLKNINRMKTKCLHEKEAIYESYLNDYNLNKKITK